jgi:hypothetical protein
MHRCTEAKQVELSVPRAELLSRLVDNRKTHRAIFDEAVEGYRREAVKQLRRHIVRIRAGGLEKVYVSLPVPEEHTGDYDAIIGLIEMAVEDNIPLTDDDYRSYVLDDWDWKRQFITSNAYYSSTAAAQNG